MASSTDVETPEAARSEQARTTDAPHAKRRAFGNAARRVLMATFVNRNNADRALDVVRRRDGYSEDDVSVLRSEHTREKYFGDDRHEHVEVHMANKVPEGASTGALIGAVLGALAGAFGGVTVGNAIGIPALGIALTGALSSILAGIGTGGTLGGIIGGLVGAVFPEERAVRHEGDFDRGGLVLGIRPHNQQDADYFYQKWEEASGERVYFQAEGSWDLFKAQLREQYGGRLSDNEIDPYMGQRERLIGHIREKMGESHDEVEQRLRQAAEREHYDFGDPTDRPGSERWEAFREHLLDVYRAEGLTREELDEHRGQRERFEGHLQERTGQSQREVAARIEDAQKASGYSF
jgi:uncharacterized protein YjbJ (UPF0337 family)